MKTSLILCVSISTFVGCVGPPVRLKADVRSIAPDPKEKDPAERVAKVFELHNVERTHAKLSTLEISPRLTKAARRHADDMARRKAMSHQGSDGSTSADRVKEAGYLFKRTGENVAYGRFAPAALMTGWMNSPTHKKNILGGFSQIGVACATDEDGTTYWCVTFGLPARR